MKIKGVCLRKQICWFQVRGLPFNATAILWVLSMRSSLSVFWWVQLSNRFSSYLRWGDFSSTTCISPISPCSSSSRCLFDSQRRCCHWWGHWDWPSVRYSPVWPMWFRHWAFRTWCSFPWLSCLPFRSSCWASSCSFLIYYWVCFIWLFHPWGMPSFLPNFFSRGSVKCWSEWERAYVWVIGDVGGSNVQSLHGLRMTNFWILEFYEWEYDWFGRSFFREHVFILLGGVNLSKVRNTVPASFCIDDLAFTLSKESL